jgi:hypothetical protein
MAAAESLSGSSKRWQRHEARVVRPFRSIDDYLKDVAVRLYPDAQFVTAPVMQQASIDRERLAPQVQIPAIPLNLEDAVGLTAGELRLLVSVEDRLFKNTVIAVNKPLSEHAGGTIDLDKTSIENITWASDTRVHVSLVLGSDRAGEVGTAQRAGSWLAQKTFHLSRPNESSTFEIKAVEPEYFVSLGLPPTTTYLVDILDDDLNQPCENLPTLVKISLHKDVHTALGKDEQSLVSQAFVKSLYVDVVTTILATGYRALKDGVVAPNSVLDTVTKRLSKASNTPEAKIRSLSSDASGTRLKAIVQAEIEMTKAVVNAARRKAV